MRMWLMMESRCGFMRLYPGAFSSAASISAELWHSTGSAFCVERNEEGEGERERERKEWSVTHTRTEIISLKNFKRCN